MKSLRTFIVVTVLGCLGFASQQAEAALAGAAGGSALSGTLSKNKAIRKQQLIADPPEPVSGSISVTYNQSVVTLSDALFGPGYEGSIFVEVFDGEGTQLVSLGVFLDSPYLIETGYVQTFFNEPTIITAAASPSAAPTHGQITPPAGYTIIANDGPFSVDTHALFFTYLPNVPDSTNATYTIFADDGSRGFAPDFLFDGTTTYTQIASATVTGNLDSNAIPIPAAVWIGGMTMLGSLGYAKLRRGRIA